MVGYTMTEKILSATVGHDIRAGAEVKSKPDFMIAYDFPGYTDKMFAQMYEDLGITKLQEPERYLVFMDHMLTKGTEVEREIHNKTREWCEFYGIKSHEAEGIGHQLTIEYGYAQPGRFLIHFDGHVSGVGAYNALGWGVRRDLIEGWATGSITLQVPKSVQIVLHGKLKPYVDARDVLHTIISKLGADGCAHKVLEFAGDGVADLSLDQRQSLCGMAMFTGAVSAIFPPDSNLDNSPYVKDRAGYIYPDSDAVYDFTFDLDLGSVEPQVVRPGSARAENTCAEQEVRGTRIQRAFIGSCVSGRLQDFQVAAELLSGRKVNPDVELNVVPSSTKVYDEAERLGYVQVLRDAGAKLARSSCDFCFGYERPLVEGEVSISTGVLNISGRMGSTRAQIYMGSAATVAQSALDGFISSPLSSGPRGD